MNSAGRTNADSASLRAWLWLVGLAFVVLCGVIIGVQVLAVGVGLLFPPMPPVPTDARQSAYETGEWGEATWTYTTSQNVCEVVAFYAQRGTCDVFYGCAEGQVLPINAQVAVCEGQQSFSEFVMLWDAAIATDNQMTPDTRITIKRRVLWTTSD